ncbi:MAG: phosphatase PAP2 family protein [candidate division KSB1 bacterium]|nr:phosphatase PAP2 family protein [candidate division KSB1 bacterium]MDZ7274522.1 phosphatase PAP2 family protein [candidate division KSB1 bacterium]MDZ7284817.1 phosphatase PAP2 family protein [candidate division KSB1 bacterium]MDZ7297763.1 phosphatase PAP2 family protein [candidate division KSB1 bacterium]MDZ7308694.1 phosphatase PAP2 family protein [candidate division KSB1 bacterium]
MPNRISRFHDFWRQRLLLFDKLTLGYLVLVPLLILLSGKHVHLWPVIAVAHPLLIAGILALVRSQHRLPAGVRWLRDWYPMLLFTFFFSTVGRLVTLFLPFWLEPFLLRSDFWFWQRHPWEFFSQHLDRVTTEVFSFAYWSYYLLIPAVAAVHYAALRPGRNGAPTAPAFQAVMNRLCLVMYTCYACFLLLPARGPHHVLNLDHDLLFAGGWFYRAILFIQSKGSVVGAAFPSSHVAAAWTMLLTLRKSFRKLFWTILPLVVLLSLSIFVIQYHYVLDAFGGVLVAVVIEAVMSRRENRRHQTVQAQAVPLPRASLQQMTV